MKFWTHTKICVYLYRLTCILLVNTYTSIYCFDKFIQIYHPNPYQGIEYYSCSRSLYMSLPSLSFFLHFKADHYLFFSTILLPVLELHINGVIQYELFCKTSFIQQKVLRILHVLCVRGFLKNISECYVIVWKYHSLFFSFPYQ